MPGTGEGEIEKLAKHAHVLVLTGLQVLEERFLNTLAHKPATTVW